MPGSEVGDQRKDSNNHASNSNVPKDQAPARGREQGGTQHARSSSQGIADASNGLNQLWLKAVIDLFSQIVNININDIACCIAVIRPDMIGDLCPRKRLARMA